MEKTFLQIVADDLWDEYQGQFDDLTIIFPNKRASLFLNQYLSQKAGSRPIWTPQYLTISEVFQSLSDTVVADHIQLVALLHKVFNTFTGSPQSLDKFFGWGETMLSDFDDIDNNMANAQQLLANVTDLRELDSYDYLSDNQRQAIEHYFKNYLGHLDKSKLKAQFYNLWQHLYPTYVAFRKTLTDRNMSYEGMLKRNVIEGIKNGSIDIASRLSTKHFAVVGFNVLNRTETELFKALNTTDGITTYFYWDYDEAYVRAPFNKGDGEARLDSQLLTFEAGRFIQENINNGLVNRLKDNTIYHNFKNGKQITFVRTATENSQARFAEDWIKDNNIGYPLNTSAIVLCNEGLLQPVLHSIPSTTVDAEGKVAQMVLNVTMGYPMVETPAYTYIDALMNYLISAPSHSPIWRNNALKKLLKHPFAQRAGFDNEELRNVSKLTPQQMLATLKHTFKQIAQSFNTEANVEAEVQSDASYQDSSATFLDQLYKESIYGTYTVLNRLSTLYETGEIHFEELETLSRLIRQLIRQKTIAFHGEPAVGLQVMGLLETRNLDFENILITSVNEGNMPKNSFRTSLIPYNLRDAYGMTTVEKEVSLYAYYFYRLLQRAKNITITYNNTADGLQKGEMSRFMLQLLVDAKKILGDDCKIRLLELSSKSAGTAQQTISVKKTPKMLQALRGYKFSPSSLNTYLNCGLSFYLKYVCKMFEVSEDTEEVDSAMFGSLIHKAMETIYDKNSMQRRVLNGDFIRNTLNNRQLIDAHVNAAFATEMFGHEDGLPINSYRVRLNGTQLINKHAISHYVSNILNFDAHNTNIVVLGTEKKVSYQLPVQDFHITVGGSIDRLDLVAIDDKMRLRIVDYKSSGKAQKAQTLDALFDNTKENRPYQIFQALCYCDILCDPNNMKSVMSEIPNNLPFAGMPELPVASLLLYFKEIKETSTPYIYFGSTKGKNKDTYLPITDFKVTIQEAFHQKLIGVAEEIFDLSKDFEQDKTMHNCQWCPFKDLCHPIGI